MANKTIFAPVNGYNKGAISIIRVSGPKVKKILVDLCKKKIKPQTVNYSSIFKKNGQLIDKCIIIYFEKPKSSTGEDVAEFHLHGSKVIIKSLEEVLSGFSGVYKADRGDFTKQAFFNNKIDLVQAEGLGDLIDAETETQKQLAQNALIGGVSKEINHWRKRLINLNALLESLIDFSDEEIPPKTTNKFNQELNNLLSEIHRALEESIAARRIREGLKVVIVGPPNAGKSSLINKIVNQEVSIVDKEEGTTRDIISITVDLGGVQTTFYDTAGLHKSKQNVEKIGIKKAKTLAKNCDILLRLVDGSKEEWKEDLKKLPNTGHIQINVINKSDIFLQKKDPKKHLSGIIISTKTKFGIENLLNEIKKNAFILIQTIQLPSVIRERHVLAVKKVRDCLVRAKQLDIIKDPELLAEEIRHAVVNVGRITGVVDVEDILSNIFNQFCIGK